MPTWILVVAIIAAVVVVGLFRERWRLSGVERICQSRGFQLITPFTPSDRPPMAALALRFAPRGARLWGAAIRGHVDGIEVLIAEYEATLPGQKTGRWHTLAAWPQPQSAVESNPGSGASVSRTPDGWASGGDFADEDGFVAWRTDGLLTPKRLTALLEQIPAARARVTVT